MLSPNACFVSVTTKTALVAMLGVLSVASLPTHAETLNASEVRSCAFIEDSQLRLRCFDDAVNRDSILEQVNQDPAALPAPDVSRVEGLQLFPKAKLGQGVSWVDHRWELTPATRRGLFEVRPYKPVYMLPVFFNGDPNQNPTSPNPLNVVGTTQNLDTTEAKFQISLKTKLAENLLNTTADVWFGYTQSSRWQVYNEAVSRPFRETNYEPEVMAVMPSSWSAFEDLTGFNPKVIGLGFNHQSNGRALPFSRSWNRIIGMVGFERGDTLFQVRPWARVPEDEAEDDNPDISDYMGRMDYLLVHKDRGHEFSLLVRHNLRFNNESRGAFQFDWAFPIQANLRGHLQWFSGYGESLIDYNHRSDYIGLGVSLVGWY